MQEWFLPNAHRTVAAGVGAGLDDFKGFIPLGMGKGATGATGGGTGTFVGAVIFPGSGVGRGAGGTGVGAFGSNTVSTQPAPFSNLSFGHLGFDSE